MPQPGHTAEIRAGLIRRIAVSFRAGSDRFLHEFGLIGESSIGYQRRQEMRAAAYFNSRAFLGSSVSVFAPDGLIVVANGNHLQVEVSEVSRMLQFSIWRRSPLQT